MNTVIIVYPAAKYVHVHVPFDCCHFYVMSLIVPLLLPSCRQQHKKFKK